MYDFKKIASKPMPEDGESLQEYKKRMETLESFQEDPESFFTRKGFEPPFPMQEKIAGYDWDWAAKLLEQIFDFSPRFLPAFYSNKKLFFWQGAQTWILGKERFFLLQIRNNFKKGSHLFYSREEVLAHEAVHAFRYTRKDSFFEEIFAYLTSTSSFRRMWGPLWQKNGEIIFLMITSMVPFLLFPVSPFLGLLCLSSFFLFLGFSVFRLSLYRKIFKRAYGVLQKGVLKKHIFPILIRLEGDEIKEIAKSTWEEVRQKGEKRKESSLRWKSIVEAYFPRK